MPFGDHAFGEKSDPDSAGEEFLEDVIHDVENFRHGLKWIAGRAEVYAVGFCFLRWSSRRSNSRVFSYTLTVPSPGYAR